MRNWLFPHPFFLFLSLTSIHREAKGQTQLESSGPSDGRVSVSCSDLIKPNGCVPTQWAWAWVLCLRDVLCNHWGCLPPLTYVTLRPQIQAGVALQLQPWYQNKPICQEMTGRTWPNPSERCGVRLPTCMGDCHNQSWALITNQFTKIALHLPETFWRIKLHLPLNELFPKNLMESTILLCIYRSPFRTPWGQFHFSYQRQHRAWTCLVTNSFTVS